MKRYFIFIILLLLVASRVTGQAPTITISESVQKVCFTGAVQMSSVVYAATTGNPDSYSIDWADMTDQVSTSFAFSGAGGTVINIEIPADATAGTHTGTLTVTNGAGSGTASISVTVNALPTPSVTATETSGTPNDGTVCAGSGVTLSGGGGTSYSWDNGITNGVSFTATSTTTYTVTVTDANGCMATKTQTVTVNPPPTPAITIAETSGTANDGTVCEGLSVTLTGGGGTSYSWDNGISDGVSFVPSSTTTYTVTVTDANGCTATLAQTITVNSLPTPVVTVTETSGTANDGNVCAGTSVILTGGGGSSYSWDHGYSDGVSFIPSSTTTYTVTVTDANGCTATKPQTITVNSLPVPTISIAETSGTANDGTVCAGSNVTLTGGGGTSFSWDNGITNGAGFVPSATTTYTVTVTNASGCSDTKSQVITVRDLPTISTLGTLSYACYNAGAQTSSLAYSATTGSPVSYSINWVSGITDQGNTLFAFQPTGGTIGNISLSAGVSSGTYPGTMTLITADGCTTTQAVSETVDQLPALSGMDLQSPVCEGNSATVSLTGLIDGSQSTVEYTINAVTHLKNNVVANGSGAASFLSFPLEAADNGNDFIITRVTTETGAGCTKSFSRTHNITVNTLPAPVVTGSTTACANSTGNTYSTAAPMSSYSWSITGGTITSATNIRDIVVTWGAGPTGTLTVTSTKNSCSGTSPTHAVTINSIPVSSVTGPASACLNVPGSNYSIPSGMVSYTWSVNPADGIINGPTDGSSASVTWIATGSKTITVNYITPTGCNGISSKAVQVNALPVIIITSAEPQAATPRINDIVTYTTGGSSGWTWQVSAGGSGTSPTNSINVTWNSTGNQTVKVNYIDANGCTAASPSTYNVNVKPLPLVSGVHIDYLDTDPKVGGRMQADYTYTDGSSGNGSGCTFRWFSDGALIPGATTSIYIAQGSDVNKVLTAEVTPVSSVGPPYPGTPVLSTPSLPIEDLTAPGAIPYADLVCIEGIREAGKTLVGKYRYNCIKEEGASVYRWVRRDSITFVEEALGTSINHILTADDLKPDKEIYFEVTPVTSNFHPITGPAKRSKPMAKIFGLKDQYSIAEADAIITSNVLGGFFTGNGITSTPASVTFSPSKAGEGDHTISYFLFYDNSSFTCSQRSPQVVNVDPDIPQFSTVGTVYCHDASPFTVDVSNIKVGSINNDFILEGPPGMYSDAITSQFFGPDVVGRVDHITINPYLLKPGLNKLTYSYQIIKTSVILIGGLPRTIIFYLTYRNSVEFTVDYVSEYIKFMNLGSKYCKSADEVYISVEGISPNEGTPHWTGSFLSDIKINSAVFSPSSGTVGSTYPISYYYESPLGCTSQTLNASVTINAMPDVRFSLNPSYNVDGPYQKLVPVQWGGEFTGKGVSEGILDPKFAGVGKDTVTYMITDINGCTDTLSKYTEIRRAVGTITGVNNVVCYDTPVHTINATGLPSTGIVENLGFNDTKNTIPKVPGSSGATFDARITGEGTDTIFFSYKWDNVDYTISRIVEVEKLEDVIIYNLSQDRRICDDTTAFELNVSKTGGVFSGPVYNDPADHKDYFNPKTGTPDDTVSYVYTSAKGCKVGTTIYIHVYKAPVVDFVPVDLCIDNSTDVTMFNNLTVHADPVVRWEWVFTDESNKTYNSLETAGYLYLKGGLQKASLMAVTDKGCSVTEEKTFTLARKPEADFYWKKDCFHPDSPNDSLLLFDATTYTTLPKDFIWIREGDAVQKTGLTESYGKQSTGYVRIKHIVTTNTAGCYDEIIKDVYIRPTYNIPLDGYFEDFESGNGGWVKSDASPIWFFGTPSGSVLNSAASGNSAWFTAFPSNDTASIESPCYDFSNLTRPLIKLKVQKALDKERDGVALQYRVGDEWKWHTVGTLNDGINWYNSATISGEPGGSQVGWTTPGTYDTLFQSASHTLDELIGSTDVIFRVTYGSEGSKVKHDGFIFDDVFIGDRTRHVLVEHFMNTADSKSTEVKSLVDTIAERKEADIINIQYHTNFPGTDPYYTGNPGEINARILYYGLTRVPYTFVDGGNDPKMHALVFDHFNTEIDSNAITKRSLVNSPFVISLDPEINGRLLTVKGNIKAVERLESANLTLFIVVTEKKDTDGTRTYLNIFRKFIPDAGGVILKDNWLPGDLQTINQTWTIDKSLDASAVEIIAFVQNRMTQQVYQSSSVIKLKIAVGIDDALQNDSEYTVYPNPASDRITVDFGSQLTSDAVIRIYGIGGEILREYKAGAGSSEFTIEDCGLRGGVYMLRVTRGKTDIGYRKLVITEN